MKRSFLIKQLQSLKSQVESLLEAETGNVLVDTPSKAKSTVTIILKEMGIDPTTDPGKVGPTIENAAKQYENASFLEKIKMNWDALMAWFKKQYDTAVKYLSETAIGKSLIKAWDNITTELSRAKMIIVGQASLEKENLKKFHESLPTWQKVLLYLGILGVISAIVYLASKVTNPKEMIVKAGQAAMDSFKKSGQAIKDSFNYAKNGLPGVIKGLASIIAAPFKAIFSAAGAAMDEGLGYILGFVAVSFGTCAAVLYYRAVKLGESEGAIPASAPIKPRTQNIKKVK